MLNFKTEKKSVEYTTPTNGLTKTKMINFSASLAPPQTNAGPIVVSSTKKDKLALHQVFELHFPTLRYIITKKLYSLLFGRLVLQLSVF